MARRISLVDISSRRRRIRRVLFWGGIILAIGLLVVGLLWVIAYSGAFVVKEVHVAGATHVAEEDVRAFLELNVAQGALTRFLGSGNLLAWPDEFSGDALRGLPAATSLNIQKNHFRRTITVEVSERERLGIWCFEDEDSQACFWFDRAGVLFLPAYAAEGNLTPVLHDYSRPPLVLGDAVLPQRLLPNVISIFDALRSIDLSVREIRLSDLALEEVRVNTYNGPALFFSLRFPVVGVPTSLNKVSQVAPLSQLEYIDFRVENKVYYK
jgi:cell division septal protein FtsQ